MLKPFAAVFLLSSFCFAQQVTIRVVNSSDGQPLPGWKVDVYFVNQTQGKGALQGAQHLQTDADGVAQFHVTAIHSRCSHNVGVSAGEGADRELV